MLRQLAKFFRIPTARCDELERARRILKGATDAHSAATARIAKPRKDIDGQLDELVRRQRAAGIVGAGE
jgi:hypothetical protein